MLETKAKIIYMMAIITVGACESQRGNKSDRGEKLLSLKVKLEGGLYEYFALTEREINISSLNSPRSLNDLTEAKVLCTHHGSTEFTGQYNAAKGGRQQYKRKP